MTRDRSDARRHAGRMVAVSAAAVAILFAACSSAATPAPSGPLASPVPSVASGARAPASPASSPSEAPSTAAGCPPGATDIILATTTSTQDSGLLDVLVPAFEKASGCTVKTVAVGTGQALKMGSDGNADVLLVHSPAAEKDFMAAEDGVDRELVMHNTFLVVGPRDDPAGIAGTTSANDAFRKIADSGATFVSRGDGSGTETKEVGIWKKIGTKPTGGAYVQTGQGMAATLQVASEKGAYTLTDVATWAALKDSLDLEVAVQGDPSLLNVYHVIGVNPAKWPRVNADGAKAFGAFLLSPDGQRMIDSFGGEEFGMRLFVADAGKSEESLTWP